MSLAELRESDDAVGKGPGIQAQWERAQRDKAEVLLERCASSAKCWKSRAPEDFDKRP